MIKTKYYINRYEWHSWFAWYPVVISVKEKDGLFEVKKAWWQTIQRKRESSYADDWWEYKE